MFFRKRWLEQKERDKQKNEFIIPEYHKALYVKGQTLYNVRWLLKK